MGCSGWSYTSWVGNFYPVKMKPPEFLAFYSGIFDAVEIDSSFYGIPEASRVISWKKASREGFYFCPKVPGEITHENYLSNSKPIFQRFLENMQSLGDKLGPILLQLPPKFKYEFGIENFIDFIEDIPQKTKLAIEFRDQSWFRESVYRVMRDHEYIMVWSESPFVKTVAPITSGDVYLRLVGDRNLPEDKFGKILRSKDEEIQNWASRIKNLGDDVERIFIFANNHFQGFAPGTINALRKAFGLNEVQFVADSSPGSKQRKLF